LTHFYTQQQLLL